MTMEPLRSVPGDGVTLETFNDYSRLIAQTQDAYAQQLSRDGIGALALGAGTVIGFTDDTRRIAQFRSNPFTIPADPGVGNDDTRYTFSQLTGTTAVNYQGNGWLYVHSLDESLPASPAVTAEIRELDQPGFYMENVINTARANIVAGGVGAYTVSTVSPGAGWASQGVWFRDTTFPNPGGTPYFLWLNMGTGNTPAGQIPLRGDASGDNWTIAEHVDSRDSQLVQRILLPLLTNNGPNYSIVPNSAGGNAGFWTDTRLTAFTRTTTGGGAPGTRPPGFGDYTNVNTPSGAAMVIRTDSLRRA